METVYQIAVVLLTFAIGFVLGQLILAETTIKWLKRVIEEAEKEIGQRNVIIRDLSKASMTEINPTEKYLLRVSQGMPLVDVERIRLAFKKWWESDDPFFILSDNVVLEKLEK